MACPTTCPVGAPPCGSGQNGVGPSPWRGPVPIACGRTDRVWARRLRVGAPIACGRTDRVWVRRSRVGAPIACGRTDCVWAHRLRVGAPIACGCADCVWARRLRVGAPIALDSYAPKVHFTCQPTATPWENAPLKERSPERASQNAPKSETNGTHRQCKYHAINSFTTFELSPWRST